MKKTFMILTALLCLAFLFGSEANAEGRKLTVMVYMCGSNLESEYGSATADILEMASSGFSPADTTVLVMMGGAGSWQIAPGLEETVIMEIGQNQQRIVWRSEQQNMGSAETLIQLLNFGRWNRPADDYALILWNHGAGPLEGVCWDELFSMDCLTLDELTEGIQRSSLPGKLCWIGFDACLMGSAEVAAAVAPYAKYMIASEETEPAAGWNYAFLKDANGDGAATGRRIVDCYFDALTDSRDPLTMACIDLGAVGDVVSAMDTFFPPIDESISAEHFADFSRIRSASSGFGKGNRAVGEEGYDLVDLADLAVRYGGENSDLTRALEKAVVYVRSDSGTACGLSVYHPYANKRKYLERWRDEYRRLDFSAAYARYTEHFGAMLTGRDYVDWSGMTAADEVDPESGDHTVRLQLTEAQANAFLSGELWIMARDRVSSSDDMSLAPIAVIPVSSDGTGGLSAVYSGTALYAVSEDGKVLQGPISYQITDDGDYHVILAVYHDYSSRADARNETGVLYYCVPGRNAGDLEIARTYVYDRVTGTYTNRIPFTEEGFSDVYFHYFLRNLPDSRKAIPGFEDWDLYDGYLARSLLLPCSWRLRFLEEWNADALYAVFQVTDIHQNRWSSIPVPIANPRTEEWNVQASIPETEGLEIHCTVELKATLLNPSLQCHVQIRNNTERTLSITGTDVILNGTRSTMEHISMSKIEPGSTEAGTVWLRTEPLTGLERITSMDFSLSVSDYEDSRSEPAVIPVHLDLSGEIPGPLASAAPEPLDTFRDGEITWQLVSMRQEADGTISGILHMVNSGDQDLEISGMLLVNGMQTNGRFLARIARGTDAYIPFEAEDCETVSRFPLHIAETDRLHLMGVNQALEQAGYTAADRLDIYPGLSFYTDPETARQITLRMPEGVALQPAEDMPEPELIFEYGGIHVFADCLLVADDGIGFGLRLENETDNTVLLQMIDPVLDGKAYDGFYLRAGVKMPPHTRAVYCMELSDRDGIKPGDPAETLSFRFRIGNMISSPVQIGFPAGTVFGAKGGTLLNAGGFTVSAAEMEDKPMVLNETIADPVENVQPVLVTAPLTPEEADLLESGNVSICLMTREKSLIEETPEQIATRTVLNASLQRNGNEWTAWMSGLAVTVQGHPLLMRETQLTDDSWQLKPDDIYFYKDADACPQEPGPDSLFFAHPSLYSDIRMTVNNTSGHVSISDKQMRLTSTDYYSDPRTNVYLEEIAEGAVEIRVFFGSNRLKNVYTIDYYERFMLSLEEPVTLELVPIESLEGQKCLYYVLFFTDGSRKDVIIDPESGEVLDSTFTPPAE